MKMQKLLKWKITTIPQNSLVIFSLFIFIYLLLLLCFLLSFSVLFPFLSGSISGNMQWNNIPHSLPRGKDTCISKDASMQCYLGTLKWNIQLVFHLSAARQQQVTRGNILLSTLNWLRLGGRVCSFLLKEKNQEMTSKPSDLFRLELHFSDL